MLKNQRFLKKKRFKKIYLLDLLPSPSPSINIQIICGESLLEVIRQNIAE
jgi:hypothetical protein